MKSKSFNITQKTAFDVCTISLKKFGCKIIDSNFSLGTIMAKKGATLLSFGHHINVSIKRIDKRKIKISISSNSVGVQIVDWGTNSKNEAELIELITNSFR